VFLDGPVLLTMCSLYGASSRHSVERGEVYRITKRACAVGQTFGNDVIDLFAGHSGQAFFKPYHPRAGRVKKWGQHHSIDDTFQIRLPGLSDGVAQTLRL
jgi:hypothetical protein